jgi:tetratricopeptide (TPR) repeat protein
VSLAPSDPAVLKANSVRASLEEDMEMARRTLKQKCNNALRTATTTSDRAAKLDAALAAALLSLDPSDHAILMADIVRASHEEDIDQRAVRLTDVLVRCRAATQALPRGDLTEDLEPHLAAAQAVLSNLQSKLEFVERRLKGKLLDLRVEAIQQLVASEEAPDRAAAVELALLLADLEQRAFFDAALGIALHVDRRTWVRALCVLVTLLLETNRTDEAQKVLRVVFRLQSHSDTSEERFIVYSLLGAVYIQQQEFNLAHNLFSKLLPHCDDDYRRSVVVGSIAAAEFGLGNREAAATLCSGLLGLSLDSTAPMASNGTIGCVVCPSVHLKPLLHAMGRSTTKFGGRADDAAPAPGTPPPAGPASAAASAPTTPEAKADAIAAAAAALSTGIRWVPDADPNTGTEYESSPDAPYTSDLYPRQLLEICSKRLGDYVLALSGGGFALDQASTVYVAEVGLPYAMPKRSKNNVVVANRLTGTCRGPGSADLSARKYIELVSRCIAALAPQAMVSLGILVDLLGGGRDVTFPMWSRPFEVLAVDIANTMSQDEDVLLFESAGYQHCFLQDRPPVAGFQQLNIQGAHSTSSGKRALVATILVVIPQPAGNHPCRRVADCLKQAKALASRSGTWVFVVVIDVGKLGNKSGCRSFGTPPPS